MRQITAILILFFSQTSFGQIKFGTYSQLDTSFYADLKIYSDNKFDFYDTRNSSCFVWTHYIGNWKLEQDTITFSWESNWSENSDSIISRTDLKNKNIEIKFLYDDGKPIANVKTSLSCLFDNNSKVYYTDNNGKVTIPQKVFESSKKGRCALRDRMLSFDIKNKTIKLSSKTSLGYYADSLSNIFTIIIKKKPKSGTNVETKKYLVQKDSLLDIDTKEFFNYNWGDFKFSKTTYGR